MHAAWYEKNGTARDVINVGERVWLWNAQWRRAGGTCAEWCCVPGELACPLPRGVAFEAGACMGIPAMPAHRAVFSNGKVGGKTILVTGGVGIDLVFVYILPLVPLAQAFEAGTRRRLPSARNSPTYATSLKIRNIRSNRRMRTSNSQPARVSASKMMV